MGHAFQTPGVIFTPEDAVIPDVVWISRERLAQGVDEAGHLTVAPELIVEVLSPGERNEQRDGPLGPVSDHREVKVKLYSIYGVQEYWIVRDLRVNSVPSGQVFSLWETQANDFAQPAVNGLDSP